MNTIFIDVDTQLDFLCAAGALYAPGAEKIAPNVSSLARYAAAEGIKILSTADAHFEDDPEFRTWKPHCVCGTAGQQKLASTLLQRRYLLSTAKDALPLDAATAAQQVIVEKQHVDCFTNPHLLPLLQAVNPGRFIVYGLVTEVCVQYTALGLLQRGYPVEIVADAIQPFSPIAGRQALDSLVAAGAKLTSTAAITH